MLITASAKGGSGSFSQAMKKLAGVDFSSMLASEGREAVTLFAANTPINTGKTAKSWSSEVASTKYGYDLIITNSNLTQSGVPIPVIINTGHATRTGGYVPPLRYIDPIVETLGKRISSNVDKGVRNG